MDFPKTLIVGLNLHGEIPLDATGKLITKPLENNFVIKLNTVSPGVPNISTFENYNNLSEITRKLVESNNWLNEPMKSERLFENNKQKMVDFVEKLKTEFMEENKENVKGIEKEYQVGKKRKDISEHQQNFIYNYASSFTISQFNKGDLIVNKQFYKFTPAELERLEIDDIDDEDFTPFFISNADFLYNFY